MGASFHQSSPSTVLPSGVGSSSAAVALQDRLPPVKVAPSEQEGQGNRVAPQGHAPMKTSRFGIGLSIFGGQYICIKPEAVARCEDLDRWIRIVFPLIFALFLLIMFVVNPAYSPNAAEVTQVIERCPHQ